MPESLHKGVSHFAESSKNLLTNTVSDKIRGGPRDSKGILNIDSVDFSAQNKAGTK